MTVRKKDMTHMSYVALIAAGPGEKDLLTVRAAGLLREADVVVADADAASLAEEIVDAERGVSRIDLPKPKTDSTSWPGRLPRDPVT